MDGQNVQQVMSLARWVGEMINHGCQCREEKVPHSSGLGSQVSAGAKRLHLSTFLLDGGRAPCLPLSNGMIAIERWIRPQLRFRSCHGLRPFASQSGSPVYWQSNDCEKFSTPSSRFVLRCGGKRFGDTPLDFHVEKRIVKIVRTIRRRIVFYDHRRPFSFREGAPQSVS
jgi:hypothetical protein